MEPADDPADQEAARRALEKMPQRTLTIFLASQAEGLTYAEIARRERIPRWLVRRHMLQAIRIIAREMEGWS
jgi:DNA-directed RNA polymerase specialized sigma24 family protein